MLEYERGDLTRAVMAVLRNNNGVPLSSYEVFEVLPDVGVAVDSRQVRMTLMQLSRRGKISRLLVNEMRGKYQVKNKFILKV